MWIFDVTCQIDVKKAHDSARNEVLYFVPTEIGINVSTICIGFEPFQSRFTQALNRSFVPLASV